MHPLPESVERSFPEASLPLTLPQELWAGLAPAQREVYRTADRVLVVFQERGSRELLLREIATSTQTAAVDVVPALQLLESMSLVSIEPGNSSAVVKLRAIPDEHVRFIDPVGRTQWIFIARPLDPPELEPTELN